jgi:hypothetical protein
VLYGTDGATVPQCDELMAELDEFRALVAAEGRTAAFTHLIRTCDFHFRAYRRYLTERRADENYARFLARRGRGEGAAP